MSYLLSLLVYVCIYHNNDQAAIYVQLSFFNNTMEMECSFNLTGILTKHVLSQVPLCFLFLTITINVSLSSYIASYSYPVYQD